MKTASKFRGLTPSQIRKAIYGEPKQSQADSIGIARRSNKPRKETRQIQYGDKRLLLSPIFGSTQNATLYPSPDWFTTTKKADVSVIVPLYMNDANNLIQSWESQQGVKIEVIFVDDNCPMNSKEKTLQLCDNKREISGRIFVNSVNQGWPVCCNIGAEKATGDILVFVHPETVLTEGWLRPMTRLAKKDDVGAVGALNLEMDARTISDAGFVWSWSKSKFLPIGKEIFKNIKLSKPFVVDNIPPDLLSSWACETVSSYCMAVKKSTFLQLGGFAATLTSPDWADADFCMSLRENHLKIISQGNTQVFRPTIKKEKQDQGEIHFLNKWAASSRLDALVDDHRPYAAKKVESIVVRRRAASGDVLVAASVLPAIKIKYPEAKIYFCTDCPEVVQNNPYITKVIESYSERWLDLYLDLDMAYEYRPNTNILSAYAEACGVSVENCRQFMHTEPYESLPDSYVVLHAGKTMWAGRDWSASKFDIIGKRLQAKGLKVVCIGVDSDHKVPCDLDLRGKTTMAQLAGAISGARLFVGIDSLPMHIAQGFSVPGVCFFGSVLPHTRLYAPGKIRPVSASSLKCIGCHHRKPTPCTATMTCDVGIQDCINNVTVEHVWRSITDIIES
jgi:ADP-heptose:LPS heptosyltransferase/GT2 family glycosyltransferase